MTTLTREQVTAEAAAAGFSGGALDIAVAVAEAESGFTPTATNVNSDTYTWPDGHTGPSTDRGLWQINNWWWPGYTDAQCFDPAECARIAWTISQGGTRWTDWSTYNSGAYKQYMTSPTTVHWTQPGLRALPETDGNGDTCGPIVMLDYAAVMFGATLDLAHLVALRTKLISMGLMAADHSGMTLTAIARGMTALWGVKPVKVVPWNSGTLSEFHTDLHDAMVAHRAVIMETHNAAAFPDNQAGVQNHFLLHWGIDSSLGYWTCNGDTYTELQLKVPGSPVWATFDQLAATLPSAWCVLPSVEEIQATMPIALEIDSTGRITGAHDTTNGNHVNSGFAQLFHDQGMLGADIAIPEVSLDEGETATVLRGSVKAAFSWTSAEGVKVYGGTIAAVVQDLYNRWQTALKTPPAPPPPPPAPPPPATKPTIQFGSPAVTDTGTAVQMTVPYTLGETTAQALSAASDPLGDPARIPDTRPDVGDDRDGLSGSHSAVRADVDRATPPADGDAGLRLREEGSDA